MFSVNLFLFVFGLFLQAIAGLKYRDCGSKTGKLVSVAIPGCENVDRCLLKHKTNQTVSITFTTTSAVTELHAKVFGQIGPVPVPFPLPNNDACKGSNLTCPLAAGQQFTYSNAIYVDPVYPTIQVVVKWELVDQSGGNLVCFTVPVQIVSGSLLRGTALRRYLFGNPQLSADQLIQIRDINV